MCQFLGYGWVGRVIGPRIWSALGRVLPYNAYLGLATLLAYYQVIHLVRKIVVAESKSGLHFVLLELFQRLWTGFQT